MKNIAVLMGGWCSEREISLISGRDIMKALQEKGYHPTSIDPSPSPQEFAKSLLDLNPDCVFTALHGQWGEDGHIQAVLNMLKIPYTHSGLLASSLAMDKPMAQKMFKGAGMPVANYITLSQAEIRQGNIPFERPYVIKPSAEGSSVGIKIILENEPVPDLSNWCHGSAMIECYIPGVDLTVAVMNGKALGVTEIRPKRGFYDYEAKYTDGITEHIYPANITHELWNKSCQLAEQAHTVLGCRGVSRSDFRYNDDNQELVILELNTQPGMTPLSLVPEQAMHNGISFADLVEMILAEATID